LGLTPHRTILRVFGAFGAVVGIHVGSLPELVAQSQVSPFAFGVAGTIGMAANISAMSLGGRINRTMDHRSVLLLVIPAIALALGFALLVFNLWSFMMSFILLSFTLGMTDLFMNAEASIVEQELGRKVFSSYHGTASLGMSVFAIVGSVVAVMLAPWFGFLFALVPLALAWAAVYKSIPARAVTSALPVEAPVVLPRRILFFIGLAAGFNVACEGAAILWAGQLLANTSPELAAISGLGLGFYGLCSGIMRIAADGLRSRHGDMRVMTVCITIAVAGFAVLGLAPGFWISVLAFACVGCGLGVIFPCLFSHAAQLVPNGRAAALGFVATVGGAPRFLLPLLLGVVAEQISFHAVFAVCAFVAFAALLTIVFTFTETQKGASLS
jgi:MFS family permease